jgi:transcriptional regulator with XRE-family HTH domain
MPARGVPLPLLREERLRAALTQEELAEAAGVGRTTIARVENGDQASVATARKLARILGLTAAELMGLAPPPPRAPAQAVAERRMRYQVARAERLKRGPVTREDEGKAAAA